MLIEADQVVVVPLEIRHRLIRVVEDRLAERITVPFHTRDFAGFATDAGSNIDELADVVVARSVPSGDRAGVTGDRFDLQCSVTHRLKPSRV